MKLTQRKVITLRHTAFLIAFYGVTPSALADHTTNDSVQVVDIPTTLTESSEEDQPTHELLGYTQSSGGVTITMRATNDSPYRANSAYCKTRGYNGKKLIARTHVGFYHNLGPDMNMTFSADFYKTKDGHATWDRVEDINEIERVEIDCEWTSRYSEPSELIEFNLVDYQTNDKGQVFAHITAKNNSNIPVKGFECSYVGLHTKEVWLAGLHWVFQGIQPGGTERIFVKLLNIVGHDSHQNDLQTVTTKDMALVEELDDVVLYCNHTGGPE